MNTLLTNIGTILTSLLDWFGQIGSYLITNPIFIIILSIGIFSLLYFLIRKIAWEIQARKLAIGLTGSTNELKMYREWKEYEEDDNKLREEEYNSFLDDIM